MKSKTSLFNWSISKNLLKRFWPMWITYLVCMIFALPVRIYQYSKYYSAVYHDSIELRTVMSGLEFAIPFIAAIVVAMAMFGYLYNNRSCAMMTSLPIKRETMFITVLLTGLVPLLLANVIVMLITAAMGVVEFRCLLLWLACTCMSLIAFYGMAVFCAMLTGNILVLPAVYAVLNLTAYAVESCVNIILSAFVFGMTGMTHNRFIDAFSPIFSLYGNTRAGVDAETGKVIVSGLGWIAGYCIAGIVLIALAGYLYKKRNMETAGDTVAIAVLKPIFKYCMTFGTAVVTGAFGLNLFYSLKGDITTALTALAFMLIGAFIGYFASEMMMQKTLRVFRSKWKGIIISAGILAVFVLTFEFDMFGIEKKVPEAERVQSVSLLYANCEIKEKENIDKIIDLHRQIVDTKSEHEGVIEYSYTMDLVYNMDNGKTIHRAYNIDISPKALNDPESDVSKYHSIINSIEGIIYRKKPPVDVTEETVSNCYIYLNSPEEYVADRYDASAEPAGTVQSFADNTKYLTPKQAEELFNDCILPDMKDGTIGKLYIGDTDEYLDNATNISISFDLMDNIQKHGDKAYYQSFGITLTLSAERTMKWILENTGFEPMSERQFQQRINELASGQ